MKSQIIIFWPVNKVLSLKSSMFFPLENDLRFVKRYFSQQLIFFFKEIQFQFSQLNFSFDLPTKCTVAHKYAFKDMKRTHLNDCDICIGLQMTVHLMQKVNNIIYHICLF